MNIKKSCFTCALNMVLCIVWYTQSLAADRVLIVHSYHAEYTWVQDINSVIEDQLAAAAIPYRIFYMDTKRKTDSAWKKESARQARQLIDGYAPRVVIAVDDNAQDLVVRHYVDNSPIQFVFAGVNADPEKYGYPAKNVTGILERAYPSQVFNLLKLIVPGPIKMAWISDDSTTADSVLNRVRQKAEAGQLPLPILHYVQPVTWDQWRKTIQKYDADPNIGGLLIPLYHTVKSPISSQSLPAADVMKWTVANTRKPIVGLWPSSADDGAICAVVVDPKEHGSVAGLMAKQIISGKRAADLPMVVNKDGFVILNLAAAAKQKIEVPFEVMLSADKIIE